MSTMVLYRIEHLSDEATIRSKDHRPRGCVDEATRPAFTELALNEKKVASGYYKGEIIHAEARPIQGWWHGEPIEEVVAVELMTAYYNRKAKYLVVEAPHELAVAAIARLNRDCRQQLRLKRVRLDFDTLIDSKPRPEIRGCWSRSEKDEIRSRAAFTGADLRNNAEFKQIRKSGKLSNLRLVCEFSDRELRVSISRLASVCFFNEASLETRLRFVQHLADEFEAKGKPRAAAKR